MGVRVVWILRKPTERSSKFFLNSPAALLRIQTYVLSSQTEQAGDLNVESLAANVITLCPIRWENPRMQNYLSELLHDLARIFNVSDPKSWLMVCGIAMVIGFLCLKGFKR